MHLDTLTSILFDLLIQKKTTAKAIAEKYGVSERSAHRYIEQLSKSLPLYVKRGRNGGIVLPDTYRLPMGFMTAEEYESAVESLALAYSLDPQERFLTAKKKLSSQVKQEKRERFLQERTSDLFIEKDLYGVRSLSDKLSLFKECWKEKKIIELKIVTPAEELLHEKVEPHLLLLNKGEWFCYAFCRNKRDFALLPLSQVHSAFKTDERFRTRPFERENLLEEEEKSVQVFLEISPDCLEFAKKRLGVESIRLEKGKYVASVLFLDDGNLENNLLSLGAGIKVISPKPLQEKMKKAVEKLQKRYQS